MEDACSPTTLSFVDDTRDDTVAGEKAHVVEIAASANDVAAILFADRLAILK